MYFPGAVGNSRRPNGFITRQGLKERYTEVCRDLQHCEDYDTLVAFVNCIETLKVIHNLRVYIPFWYEGGEGDGWEKVVRRKELELTGTNTMHIGTAFPSDYLKAADLNGGEFNVTIKSFGIEEAFDEQKPILRFNETEKGWIIGKGVANTLETILGPETDNWAGQKIILYIVMTEYKGAPVQGVRAKASVPTGVPVAPAQPMVDDEIPFAPQVD